MGATESASVDASEVERGDHVRVEGIRHPLRVTRVAAPHHGDRIEWVDLRCSHGRFKLRREARDIYRLRAVDRGGRGRVGPGDVREMVVRPGRRAARQGSDPHSRATGRRYTLCRPDAGHRTELRLERVR
jgi:hypothetical protein